MLLFQPINRTQKDREEHHTQITFSYTLINPVGVKATRKCIFTQVKNESAKIKLDSDCGKVITLRQPTTKKNKTTTKQHNATYIKTKCWDSDLNAFSVVT